MPNYKDGKIYKMVSPSGLTYVGSTTQSLALRKGKHKGNYLRWKQGKKEKNVTSFRLFDEAVDDIDIVLLEEVKCDSKEQLHMRERHWIESLECVNKVIPTRTSGEYHAKYYYPKNREKILEYHKVYGEQNKEKILAYQKEYNENNKEKIAKRRKEYREKNKEAIKEKKSEVIECECGSSYTKSHESRHKKSAKHQNFIGQ